MTTAVSGLLYSCRFRQFCSCVHLCHDEITLDLIRRLVTQGTSRAFELHSFASKLGGLLKGIFCWNAEGMLQSLGDRASVAHSKFAAKAVGSVEQWSSEAAIFNVRLE